MISPVGNGKGEKPEVTVVIITHNRAEMLLRALESVTHQETDGKFSYDIVVVDDGSTDDTSSVVKEVAIRSQVSVHYVHEEGAGIPQARNRGIAETRGKWIAFLDDDELAESDWLKEFLAFAWQHGASVVGGSVKLALSELELSALGHNCRELLGEHRHFRAAYKTVGKELPGSGNLLISRVVFERIGGFDTSMLSGGSDNDLLMRARRAGFSIWVAPNAVVSHLIPPYRLEPAYFWWVSLRWGSRMAYVDRKHRGSGKMLLLCIARIGQALLVNMPYLVLAYLKRDKSEILDRKCLLWRAMGYTRQCLFFIAPKIFLQEQFFTALEYRKERNSFGGSKNV